MVGSRQEKRGGEDRQVGKGWILSMMVWIDLFKIRERGRRVAGNGRGWIAGQGGADRRWRGKGRGIPVKGKKGDRLEKAYPEDMVNNLIVGSAPWAPRFRDDVLGMENNFGS
ncbi:hypothetical protein ACH5RR_038994 [Cinchona calisaya]|uniref:Uncharacterized protein n=1 Tax=Cinchona calisaya TaxID=153742 RepID=A0ABD2XZF1_9GENT